MTKDLFGLDFESKNPFMMDSQLKSGSARVLFNPSLVTDKNLVYDINADANNVLGPVQIPGFSKTPFLDSASSHREANGNYRLPPKYSGTEEPSFRKPQEYTPNQPQQEPSWPRKNEDGTYQVLPGAKLVIGPPSEENATAAAKTIAVGGGGLLGGILTSSILNPQLGGVAGAVIGAQAEDAIKHIIKQGRYPHFEIDGGSTNSMDAPDYPNVNRGE